ncbi:hypothetical protein AMS68_005886 [Peltaster fructicola]|uniref:WSC domain-containing protein n=1 Tax=Peltaster fructicola TaxID=286661 RepID=A0A6H0Y0H1_9PEZI|nr:hypothetical protein AMS68_005886 [Peltaster fructicola]
MPPGEFIHALRCWQPQLQALIVATLSFSHIPHIMATTRRSTAKSVLLLTLAASVNASSPTLKGCYSSSTGLSYADTYTYQSSGHCVPLCTSKGAAVVGLTNGSDCWCGDELPPVTSQADNSKCSTTCSGYNTEQCGASGYFTVWLTGTNNDVTNAAAVGGDSSSTSSSSSSSSSSSTSTPTTTTTPTVITSISPGNTVVVTVSASATNTTSASSGSGTSVAGVAAGVVIGVLAVAAIVGGILFWLRRRRRQRAEEDYKHSAQVSDFMRGGSERNRQQLATARCRIHVSTQRLDDAIVLEAWQMSKITQGGFLGLPIQTRIEQRSLIMLCNGRLCQKHRISMASKSLTIA